MDTLKIRFAGLAVAASLGLTSVTMLAMAAPAHAAAAPVQKSRTVAIHKLNLATPDGQSALHERVQRTAERLCVDRFERMLSVKQAGRECVDQAVADAAPQIERAIAAAQTVSLVRHAQP